MLREVAGDDLVAVEADPDDRDLGTAIGLERYQVREVRAFEHNASRVRNHH